PFGSGGKRVWIATCLPAAKSSRTIWRMKSRGPSAGAAAVADSAGLDGIDMKRLAGWRKNPRSLPCPRWRPKLRGLDDSVRRDFGRVRADLVAALRLGQVQRDISLLDPGFHVGVPRPDLRHAQAERARVHGRAVATTDPLDPLADPLGHLAGAFEAGLRQHHAEFVAAEAAGRIHAAQVLAQHCGDLLQQGIAGGVAVAVVDLLETVDV